MRVAIDLFWALVLACMMWACIAPVRYPQTNRFFRALNFAPANLCLRAFCGMSAMLGIAELAARYDKPWLLTHLKAVPFSTALALTLLILWALLGYALFAKRVQEQK